MTIPGIRLRAWRAIWTACVHHGAPLPILLWVEGHFLDAAMRATLRTVTDETREATAGEPWSCLAGDVEGHDAGTVDERDLHGDVLYPSSRGGKGWEA